jgi:hypothetical protein
MAEYDEDYPVGTLVRIAPLDELQTFKRDWKYHHPLQEEQLKFAGSTDRVKGVAFYHGGDALYTLEVASGIWHAVLLSRKG